MFQNHSKIFCTRINILKAFDSSSSYRYSRTCSTRGFTDDNKQNPSDNEEKNNEDVTDFFGIEEHPNDNSDSITTPKISYLKDKYLKENKNRQKFDKILPSPFGNIRFDSDNVLPNYDNVAMTRREKRKLKHVNLHQKLCVLKHVHNDVFSTPCKAKNIEIHKANKRIAIPKDILSSNKQDNLNIEETRSQNVQASDDDLYIFMTDSQIDKTTESLQQLEQKNTDGTYIDKGNENEERLKFDETEREYNSPDHISLIEEQYFGDIINVNEKEDEKVCHDKTGDFGHIDEQYFGDNLNNDLHEKVIDDLKTSAHGNAFDNGGSDSSLSTEFSFIDESYFSSGVRDTDGISDESERELPFEKYISSRDDSTTDGDHTIIKPFPETSEEMDSKHNEIYAAESKKSKPAMFEPENTRLSDVSDDFNDDTVVVNGKKTEKFHLKPQSNLSDTDQEKSAYSIAMKIREKLKTASSKTEDLKKHTGREDEGHRFDRHRTVDSKGFRILKNQVNDLQKMTSFEVVNLLHEGILYEHDDFLALNKPYGLSSHDDFLALNKPYGLSSHGGPGVRISVGQLLPELAKKMKQDGLHLIHRLDKETTGVMLVAKNPQSAYVLHGKFIRREVIKKYVVIVKGVPALNEGIIDIPMMETKVDGNYRMSVKPSYTEETKLVLRKKKDDTFNAITQFRVIDSNNATSLVECRPTTGIKHQIRAHLAFGLNTPVLGDHKYSHFTKTAPQRLHPETLQRLGVRQSKVRHIPMHLHASSLLLPEFLNGRNLFITAPLPKHFRKNMEKLKMSFKK